MGAGLVPSVNRVLIKLLPGLLGLVFASSAAMAAGNPLWQQRAGTLLPAEQAFALMPAERKGDQLKLSWNIAPGYYLYRQRLQLEVLSPKRWKPGPLQLPQGIAHVDEHFGAVQIYRGLLESQLSLRGLGREALRLRIQFQGCADAGVCYPPQSVEQLIQP